jgi:hypothetical protein
MKTESETETGTTTTTVVQTLRQNPIPAPSLRVPVTTSNRAILRRLRAAEMSAWEAADRNPRQRKPAQQVS